MDVDHIVVVMVMVMVVMVMVGSGGSRSEIACEPPTIHPNTFIYNNSLTFDVLVDSRKQKHTDIRRGR
jgi:hypothetical protein